MASSRSSCSRSYLAAGELIRVRENDERKTRSLALVRQPHTTVRFRRMRVRTGMRSIPCAATPWSMVRVHDIAIACTRLGIISTPYHGSYHVRCLFEGVPVLVGCTLYTRPRPRCLFTGCLFTDRGSGNQSAQRSFEHRYRSATGARGSRVCSVLLRLPRLAGLDGCEVRPCVFHVCARVSRVCPGSPESYFYRYCTSVRFLPKGAGGGFISGFVPYPHNTLIPN